MDEITLNGRTYTVRTEYDSDSTPLDFTTRLKIERATFPVSTMGV